MKPGKYLYAGILVLAFVIAAVSCRKEPVTPGNGNGNTDTGMVEMTPVSWYDPPHFPYAVIPEDNQPFAERIELGKKLFYDTRLSGNGESCNTCHLQENGFAAPGLSDFDKGLTKIPLVNLAWNKNFMWDGRITGTLEDVMLIELTVRFNTDLARINGIEEYRTAFRQYYGVNNIGAKDMAKPLAQFMRSLVSYNSRYDRYFMGAGTLTAKEMAGRNIFFSEKGDCFHCHVERMLSDNMMHNNGLDSIYSKGIDKGYYNFTKNEMDLGKFKTPNLRNVALRTEFMHDGRFKTLMEVINFYDHGVHTGVKNIDPAMIKPAKIDGLKLTEIEKEQLLAFLHTLTDSVMINNPDFRK